MGEAAPQEWAERVNRLTSASIHARAEDLKELAQEAREAFDALLPALQAFTERLAALEAEVHSMHAVVLEGLPHEISLIDERPR